MTNTDHVLAEGHTCHENVEKCTGSTLFKHTITPLAMVSLSPVSAWTAVIRPKYQGTYVSL